VSRILYKNISKGDALQILHYLVLEKYCYKSYRSLSSILKVNESKAKISSLKAYKIFYENFFQEGVRKIIRYLTVIVRSLDQSLRNFQIMLQVDDYSCVRHPPGHRLSESACERAHELGVPMRWVCCSSLRWRWNVVCPCVG
jgi:hypothetical protein